MINTWRLLDTPPRSAAENMALDEVVLTARSEDQVPNTLRFLQFTPPCTLVGYHQSVEQEVRISFCQEHHIDINRRLTGGGGLFWDESQLGWEIFAAQDDPHFPRRAELLYERICQGAIRGLSKLGIQAAFRPKNDIEVRGRKISGTGGTSLNGAFLFQGSLLIDFDVDTMLRALRIPTEKLQDKEIDSVKDRVICLTWELDVLPPLEQVKVALAEGFADDFGVRLAQGPLAPVEKETLAMLREVGLCVAPHVVKCSTYIQSPRSYHAGLRPSVRPDPDRDRTAIAVGRREQHRLSRSGDRPAGR